MKFRIDHETDTDVSLFDRVCESALSPIIIALIVTLVYVVALDYTSHSLEVVQTPHTQSTEQINN